MTKVFCNFVVRNGNLSFYRRVLLTYQIWQIGTLNICIMAKETGKEIGKILLAGFLGTLIVFLFAGCYFLLSEVLSSQWIVVVISMILSLITSWPLMKFCKWLTGISNPMVRYIINFVALSSLFVVIILTVNKVTSQQIEMQKGVVERLYTKTRHRTRRVGRRTYAQGPAYKVYFMDVEFGDDRTRSLEIKKKNYDDLSKGDTIGIRIKKGKLGITTFDPAHFDIPQKKRAKKRNRADQIRDRHRQYQEHVKQVMHRTDSIRKSRFMNSEKPRHD